MDFANRLTSAREFQVYLENVVIRLFLGALWDPEEDARRQLNPLHTHASAEIFVCIEGVVILKTESGYLELHPGDAAIVPNGISHTKHYSSPETVGYAFSFDCRKTDVKHGSNLYKTFLPLISGSSILVYRSIPDLTDDIEKILAEKNRVSSFLPALYFAELLLKISAGSSAQYEEVHPKSSTPKVYDIQRLLALEAFVERYYAHNPEMAVLAQELNIGVRQLSRIVKARYGKTLHEVIMDKRISASEWFLKNTEDPIIRIADRVGFSSGSGFYREFTKRHRMTPAEYRKQVVRPGE